MNKVYQRMEVSAAIDRLIDPNKPFNEQDALIVINFIQNEHSIKNYESFHVETKDSNGHVTGHTPEHGNMTVSDDRQTREVEIQGETATRAGNYKLKNFNNQTIIINPFWASDPTTRADSEPPEQYCICQFDPKENIVFGRIEYRSFQLRFFWQYFGFLLNALLTYLRVLPRMLFIYSALPKVAIQVICLRPLKGDFKKINSSELYILGVDKKIGLF